MIDHVSRLSSAWLLSSTASRMRGRHPDWLKAMRAETELRPTEFSRLGWAWGCWVAGLRLSGWAGGLYLAVLAAGTTIMAGYEWSADESGATVVLLSLMGLTLGMLRPPRAVVSGILLGAAVACVIGFEAISGFRPAYETGAQTVAHSLSWLILLAPSVASAIAGAWLGRRCRAVPHAP